MLLSLFIIIDNNILCKLFNYVNLNKPFYLKFVLFCDSNLYYFADPYFLALSANISSRLA